METYHAPAERAPKEQILNDNNIIQQDDYVKMIMNALPDIAAILNPQRQIVFANDTLLNFLSIIDKDGILGFRPGEAIKCVHSSLMEAGCGTSENCKYCGAVNAIIESQKTNSKVTRECRIITLVDDKHEYLDLQVTCTPFNFKGNVYTILTVDDISDFKRKQMLEKIFFHDIINVAGGLKGLTEMLAETHDVKEIKENIPVLDQLSGELLEEIQSQRALTAAEKGELEPEMAKISSLKILFDVSKYLSNHSVSRNKKITISNQAIDVEFTTDELLLKRVLINLLKNALEASSINNIVTLNCRLEYNDVVFSVHNQSFMPRDVQLQVFQRSFSTKGSNRGLGTYSIKLLTERYLKGSVGFNTSEIDGTTFWIKLRKS
jgi:hypothetical protein